MHRHVAHTSGLPDYENADTLRWVFEGTPLGEGFGLDFLRDRPLEFEPGSVESDITVVVLVNTAGRSEDALSNEGEIAPAALGPEEKVLRDEVPTPEGTPHPG